MGEGASATGSGTFAETSNTGPKSAWAASGDSSISGSDSSSFASIAAGGFDTAGGSSSHVGGCAVVGSSQPEEDAVSGSGSEGTSEEEWDGVEGVGSGARACAVVGVVADGTGAGGCVGFSCGLIG